MEIFNTVDIKKNLQELSAFPELYRDQIKSDYQDETKYATNKDQKVLDELSQNTNELWSLMTDYIMDENEADFYQLMKLAINSNDLCEIGRIFKKIHTAGLASYVSLNREG